MTTRRKATRTWRRHAIAVAIAAAGSALAVPAGAQLFEDRSWIDQRARVQFAQQEFFPFSWFGDRGPYAPYNPSSRLGPPVESTKAPPPRKAETTPTNTVVVIGDSFADWLGYGLEEAFADTPEIGIVRKIRPYSGLVRYEARSDALEWSLAVKETLATEKPSAIVVMLGVNDRLPLRERASQPPQKPSPAHEEAAPAEGGSAPTQEASAPAAPAAPAAAAPAADAQRPVQGASYEFHADKWADLYAKRVDEMIAALKTKGVPVLWVGLPAIRGTRSTSDMSYLDEIYRARAEKASIIYVDIWDGFVDEYGRYAVQGPDFEGQTRRLRTSDGVYFTKPGAEKLAHYVERDLRRVISNNRAIPVALPSEEQSPAKAGGAGPRPVAGPVVPLNGTAGEGGELLGAGGGPPQAASDPIATRVLTRGDAIAAPAGRADNFSWPRADISTHASTEIETAPVASGPAVPTPGAAAGKNDTKKQPDAKPDVKTDAQKKSDAKLDAKPQNAPNLAPPSVPRRARGDDAPRPPLPVGPAATKNTW